MLEKLKEENGGYVDDDVINIKKFEKWLRTVCFQKPTPEAYDLAKDAWIEATKQIKDWMIKNDSKYYDISAKKHHEDGDYSYLCDNEYCRCHQ